MNDAPTPAPARLTRTAACSFIWVRQEAPAVYGANDARAPHSSIEPAVYQIRWTEPRKGTLDEVESRENGQQVPPRADKKAESEPGERYDSGENANEFLFGSGDSTNGS